ncbi:MAG: asparagine synthase-related protein [Pseudomonadota bacterium]
MKLFASVGSCPDADVGATASRWQIGDLTVWTTPETPHIWSPAGPLLIVGEVFTSDGKALHDLSVSQIHATVASQGGWLIEHLWGRYVVVWQDPRDGAVWIARDPSGAIPLYHWNAGSSSIVFNDLAMLMRSHRAALSIDPAGLAYRLSYPAMPSRATAITDVTEIFPGEAMRLGPPVSYRQLWSPWDFASQANPADGEDVRHAVETVVAAFAQGRTCSLLELSGGLDSSIVAACLAASGHPWRAATVVTPARDGDERAYATIVADQFGAELESLAFSADDIGLLAEPTRPGVRPSGYAMLDALDRSLAALAAKHGAVLFSGTGGDNVFCSLRSAAPVIDRFRDTGLRGAMQTVGDLARLTQAPISTVMGATLRYRGNDNSRRIRWRQDRSFLTPGSVPPVAPHPWLDRPTSGRPGSRAHIVLLLRAHSVVATLERARDRPMLFPLLSQPVVETCLRIASWRWVAGGVDRAVARQAFADRLPAAIVQRRTKGRLTSLLAPAYNRDRAAIGSLLCEGELARHSLVDCDAIRRAIGAPATYDGGVYMRLLELVDAELWARAIARLS